MRLTGTLKLWNDERGFGFITAQDGGPDIFLHISALPRDGTRPVPGESLSYELVVGKNDQPRAANVIRLSAGETGSVPADSGALHPATGSDPVLAQSLPARTRSPEHLRHPPPPPPQGAAGDLRRMLAGLVLLPALMALGLHGWGEHQRQTQAEADLAEESSARFNCDGRAYCSQMRSCSEAKFFLRNCPGVQMDGDRDGTPCERQWCMGPH